MRERQRESDHAGDHRGARQVLSHVGQLLLARLALGARTRHEPGPHAEGEEVEGDVVDGGVQDGIGAKYGGDHAEADEAGVAEGDGEGVHAALRLRDAVEAAREQRQQGHGHEGRKRCEEQLQHDRVIRQGSVRERRIQDHGRAGYGHDQLREGSVEVVVGNAGLAGRIAEHDGYEEHGHGRFCA